MRRSNQLKYALGIVVIAATAMSGERAFAQTPDPNSAPNPYRLEENWAKLPDGRKFGQVIAVETDRDGKSIWAFDRCGGTSCSKSNLAPIMKFDPSGKFVTSFGAGMFNFPHGLAVDREGNIWATDERAKNGKGGVALKFSPDGKVLMTLGKPGTPGDEEGLLDGPSDIVVAANGDIYIADGHGGTTNDRIVKFSKDGKFIKAWAKHGKAQGELDTPHGIALDSAGRVYVADRANSRVQIFDPDGKFIAEWKQFGRPSSVAIDKNGIIYVADTQSNEQNNKGFQQGIRIGSISDGKVTAFIPVPSEAIGTPEGITVDDQGIIYGGYTAKMNLRRFVKK
ncbi:MAG TPA: peptidyl-alpha-hydroxyglycine alpha-amidating lyase family protein [Xanthobacteraceae bacterium]|jgi:DNA-binding beta-propeller fold protein YncE|nr:peptidyl-alpha-hydroxyglycine alpha-amidating lyase family protein [Xanthobacteraceae bacterium]